MVLTAFFVFNLLVLLSFLAPLDAGWMTKPLLAVLAALTGLPVLHGLLKKQFNFFEIIYTVSASYFLYFVYNATSAIRETLYTFPWLSQMDLNRAVLYVSMGFCCMLIGYYSRLPTEIVRRLPRVNLVINPTLARTAIYALYIVGTFIRMYLLAIGSSTWSVKAEEMEFGTVIQGSGASAVGYINHCALFGYMLACIAFFSNQKTRLLSLALWGVMLPGEIIWAFLQASKNAFIPVLAAPLLASHYLRRPVRIQHILAAAAVGIFVVFPVVSEYREWASEYRVTLTSLPDIAPQIASRLWNGITSPQSDTFVGDATELVAQRLAGLPAVSNVINYVETNGIIHGETLWQWYVILIPGFILPTKGEYFDYGTSFYGTEIFGTYDESNSGVALMQAGEFYLNYGLWCLLLGMFLQGILYRGWQLYWTDKKPWGLGVFFVGWRLLNLIEVPFATAYGELLRQSLLMLGILWGLTLWNRSRSSEPALAMAR